MTRPPPPWSGAAGERERAVTAGLRRRLLILLLLPLAGLALVNAWFDYRSADDAALQHDRTLLRLVPLLADSIVAPPPAPGDAPVLLLAPPVEAFLRERPGFAAFAVFDSEGRLAHGETWLAAPVLPADEPAFHSEPHDGVVYRVVAQRMRTAGGDYVLTLADGSDPRQRWARAVLIKVLLPNLVLLVAAAAAVSWAVRRALRPLVALKQELEHRSPRDLSALDEARSPDEVRPLVQALNHLFGLVNAQAESQRRFVADAAHQLRTPLAALQAQVEAWSLAADSSKPNLALGQAQSARAAITLGADELRHLRDATRRTSQLAHQLLALSRADARAIDAQPMEAVDLKALCEGVLQDQLDAATAKRIDLGLEVRPAVAAGHAWLLRELLANVVDNAVRYTPAGGTVTIRCGPAPGDAGRAFLAVEDDGPGIAPAERGRALQRFYRLPGTVGEGNGLGLAIADEIAHLHRTALVLGEGSGGRGLLASVVFQRAGD